MFEVKFTKRAPRYRQISEHIRQKIVNGILNKEEKLPSDPEMCEILGVSVGTLKGAYDELARQGLIVRRPGPGGGTFVVKDIPRPKTFHENRDVGIVRGSLGGGHYTQDGGPYADKIVEGALQIANESGYKMHVFTANGCSVSNGNPLLRECINSKVIAGLILTSQWSSEELIALQEHGCPFVVTDNLLLNIDVPAVMLDDAAVAYNATKQLIAEGHTRIAVATITWEPAQSNFLRRPEWLQMGYESALRESGVDYRKFILKAMEKKDVIEEGTDGLMAELDHTLKGVTAFISDGDWFTSRVVECAERAGKTIGEDIELVVYADSIEVPGARTIFKPLKEMGQAAMQMLVEQLSGVPGVRKRIIPVPMEAAMASPGTLSGLTRMSKL